MPEGRATNQPVSVSTRTPSIGISLYKDVVRTFVIASPSTSVAVIELAFNCFNLALAAFVQAASIRPKRGSPQPSTILVYSLSTVAPMTAYISMANRAITIPSLSVVHTVPSFFRNDAPADSSPPIPISPSNNKELKYLKPTGTS